MSPKLRGLWVVFFLGEFVLVKAFAKEIDGLFMGFVLCGGFPPGALSFHNGLLFVYYIRRFGDGITND